MLQEGNEWNVDVHYCILNDPPIFYINTEVVTMGETVQINGKDYIQVYKDDQPTCLLREANGVVYKLINGLDAILFDMNMSIGETYDIIGSAFNYPCSGVGSNNSIFIIEVMDIRTEFIAGQDRKVIVFTDHYFPGGEDLWWIEGIGTRAGLDLPWPFWDFTCGSFLSCFTTNGETFFMNGATSCDNTTLEISESEKTKIVLYPNPITNTSILQLPEKLDNVQVTIYNTAGQLVKAFNPENHYLVLNSTNFSSGLYFYKVLAGGKEYQASHFVVK